MGMINRTFIEDAVIVSEKEQKKEHPNFIESNTSGITLEELETNCIVPSFGDNQLTISHQTFIHRIEEAASMFFAGETFGNTEIRVSHKILGRHPSALTKRKEELKPEDETIYYQRMAFCFHIRTICREMNGEEVHLCIGGVRSLNEENSLRERFHYFIRGERQQCRIPQAVCRRATVTRASRSKARLRPVATRRDSWRSHVHRTQFRRPRSSSSYNLPMQNFSRGIERGILSFEREYPPFHFYPCSAIGTAIPHPRAA